MKRPIIILGILITVVYACTHDHIIAPVKTGSTGATGSTGSTGTTGTGTGGTTVSDSVCFQTDVLPLYQTYCGSTGCHDAATHVEGLNLTTFANISRGIAAGNPNNSRYYTILQDGMPPRNSPQLSSAQIATIAKWINQGAVNHTCTVTTCDTTKTTYSNGISAIFATYCNGCHGVAPGSGGVVLSDYASAKAAGTGMKTNFLNAIKYTSTTAAMNMPQSGKLADCQITQITKWINAGCPQ